MIGLDSSSNSICVNPERVSKTERYCAPDKACNMSVCFGMGCWSATVALLSLRQSMQTRGLPLQYTMMMGAPQGLLFSFMIFCESYRFSCLLMILYLVGEA